MHVDFFSGTFYAMRTGMKKKYKLLTADSADYYLESLFILSVQAILCIAIWKSQTFEDFFKKPQLVNDYSVNLCLFFTSLVLHFSCIATVRNGM